MADARCMRCKVQVPIKEERIIKTKNGRNMLTGLCPRCGTRLSKFV